MGSPSACGVALSYVRSHFVVVCPKAIATMRYIHLGVKSLFTSAFFFGGPVEEKAFTDLVKRWKLSRMGVNSSASVSGTRKTCWLECSGSLRVPSSVCLVVCRYGTLHAHGREDAQHTSFLFETKHFERSMGGGVASPTAIVPRQLELALQEYEGAREVGVLERLWCRLGPCNVAHARWDLVMMRARPV